MEIPRKLAVKVGALGALAIAVGFVVMLLIGGDGTFFASTRTYHTAFSDVAGLREGAIVRLGGRVVGEVTEIVFGPLGSSDRALVVTFQIREEHAARIRTDAVVTIGSLGLLGEKLLEVSLGSVIAGEVPDGGWLTGRAPADPAKLIGAATAAAEHAQNILARLDAASRDLDASGAMEEVRAISASLRRIVERVETGPGLAHALIYDEELARDTTRAIASIERAAGAGARVLGDARSVMAKVDQVAAAVDPASVGGAIDDFAAVAKMVREGKGTLGGLLADPTLYEETKRILVNIRRNRVLKAVARVVISDDLPDEIKDASPGSVVVHPRPGPGERVNVSGKKAAKDEMGETEETEETEETKKE